MPEPRSRHQIRELALFLGSDSGCVAILALSLTRLLVVGEASVANATRPCSDSASGDGSSTGSGFASLRLLFLHLADPAIRPSAYEPALLLDPDRDAWIHASRARRSSSTRCSPERWRDWPVPFESAVRETVPDPTLRSPEGSLLNILMAEMVAVQART